MNFDKQQARSDEYRARAEQSLSRSEEQGLLPQVRVRQAHAAAAWFSLAELAMRHWTSRAAIGNLAPGQFGPAVRYGAGRR